MNGERHLDPDKIVIVALRFGAGHGNGVRAIISHKGTTTLQNYPTWEEAARAAEAEIGQKLSSLKNTFRSTEWSDGHAYHTVVESTERGVRWAAGVIGDDVSKCVNAGGEAAFWEEGIEHGRKSLKMLLELAPKLPWKKA